MLGGDPAPRGREERGVDREAVAGEERAPPEPAVEERAPREAARSADETAAAPRTRSTPVSSNSSRVAQATSAASSPAAPATGTLRVLRVEPAARERVEPAREPPLRAAPHEQHLAAVRSVAEEHDRRRDDRLGRRRGGRDAGVRVAHPTSLTRRPRPRAVRARRDYLPATSFPSERVSPGSRNSARRFFAHAASPLPASSGSSLPKETVSNFAFTPRSAR